MRALPARPAPPEDGDARAFFDTPHRLPQLPLWIAGDDDWLPVLRLPAYAQRRPRPPGAVQPPLFPLEEVDT